MVEVAIITIIILVLILCLMPKNRRGGSRQPHNYKKYVGGKRHKDMKHPHNMRVEYSDKSHELGLSELIQDNLSRGQSPYWEWDQPNHVSNRWKSVYSHPYLDDMGRNESHYDSYLQHNPSKPAQNYYVSDHSAMHLTSRFAGAN